MESTESAAPAPAPAPAERHAGWNELFFDLVVVAGAGQLAHLLHDGPDPADLALYAVLYLAFWTTWAGFAVYGDIAASETRVRTLLVAMFGMAVMAASVHTVQTGHAVAFVIAYVALRWQAGRVWQRGSIVVDWPLAQFGSGAVPWLVSLFVDAPLRYWLWALGIALDIVTLLVSTRDRTLRRAHERAARHREGRPPPGPAHGPAAGPPRLSESRVDTAHMGERLGLYVIIVLGEGVIQIIGAASERDDWDGPLAATGLGAFGLLAGICTLSLLYGTNGIPHLRKGTLAPRLAMLLHAVMTGFLVALATALGSAITHVDDVLPRGQHWLLCGAVAGYFAAGLVAALPLANRSDRVWLLGWALPCLTVSLALAPLGERLPAWATIWILVALVCWQILYDPGRAGMSPSGRRRWGGRIRRTARIV
ncbi:low temperature requirement protein A [Streptomyces sp. KAI-26]|uniref:low temperature requirement protein A n=1 Tax=unclassified Streptomyces TaxID=2593676 RepID=UPI00158625C6|nr:MULTISPECIES: low temperature requirement protein A [unclassified Streptomyces]NUV42319.1 low temperature requirement protein A [Streptomyces sp. CAI-24]NUV82932.1 low temperature requirement protein A [Streptomyces sp. CAI-155]NUV90454.1 low temperature requirement protein A [Streptomyces sp. KAI-26]NUW24345.1 low temperature requirement protein A [Streptomyces roseoviolaceus]